MPRPFRVSGHSDSSGCIVVRSLPTHSNQVRIASNAGRGSSCFPALPPLPQ